MRSLRPTGRKSRDRRRNPLTNGKQAAGEVKLRVESLREEEVLRLEAEILQRLEERLTPIMHQVALDTAKTVMHELRLDILSHLSRHEDTIRRLRRSEAATDQIHRGP